MLIIAQPLFIDAILLQPVAVRNTLPIQIDIKRSGEYQAQVKSHDSSASALFGRQRQYWSYVLAICVDIILRV